jgi:hypothetical protein
MAQMLYTIAAIMILAVVVMMMNVKIHNTNDRMMFSELSLDMTGVGNEILDHIETMHFNQGTISCMVVPVEELSTTFGTDACDPDDENAECAACNPNANYADCFTVGDFHGAEATRIRSRVFAGEVVQTTYRVSDIRVEFVAEDAPHAVSASPTFAKRVRLNVSTPVLVDASGNEIAIEMARIYTHPMRYARPCQQ